MLAQLRPASLGWPAAATPAPAPVGPVTPPISPALAVRAWVCLHGVASRHLHKPGLTCPTPVEVHTIAAALLLERSSR